MLHTRTKFAPYSETVNFLEKAVRMILFKDRKHTIFKAAQKSHKANRSTI